MEVRYYSLLCNYKTEFPEIKRYFMKNGIPFETDQFNNKMTMVIYSCTELDRLNFLHFTLHKFGW